MQEARPSTGFWGSLSDREQAVLAGCARETVFRRGTPLCVEGDPATHLYVLLAGWAKVVSVTVDGHEVFLALRGPGELVGELAGELDGHRTATVSAVVGVRALGISAERFMAFIDAHPGAARAYRRVMARHGHESDDNLRWRLDSSGAQRLARLLLDLADRCGEPAGRGVALAVPLSQADLASWVGASRATVTRALRQWRDRGLVSTRHGHLAILDPAALRRISGAAARAAGDRRTGSVSARRRCGRGSIPNGSRDDLRPCHAGPGCGGSRAPGAASARRAG